MTSLLMIAIKSNPVHNVSRAALMRVQSFRDNIFLKHLFNTAANFTSKTKQNKTICELKKGLVLI